MPPSPAFRPSTRHAELGEGFFDVVAPAPFPAHILRHRDRRWDARVGLDTLTDAEWIAHFGRFEPLPGGFPEPLALRYHGHQFRVYNPDLGDGRGFLFAQLHDLRDGRLLDLGTKGSGKTPWSRGGDGRLTLKGGVREVLATAMLEALGVETSKSFSLIETGEALVRNDEPSPTRSAVLVRLSHSHIRIGSFQRFALPSGRGTAAPTAGPHDPLLPPRSLARRRTGARRRLLRGGVPPNVARMGAQWTAAGFVHGVLNTDNINVTGESFDYGPWRFLPSYDPDFTAAYFDHSGLYAFGRQPEALVWNLARLGGCLLPLAEQSALEAAMDAFQPALHGTSAPPSCAASASRRSTRRGTRRWSAPSSPSSANRRRPSSGSSSTGAAAWRASRAPGGAPPPSTTPRPPSPPSARRWKASRRRPTPGSTIPTSHGPRPAPC